MDDDASASFDKSYTFRIVGEKKFAIPPLGQRVDDWQEPVLQRMKHRLNQVKSALDAMPLDEWGALTQTTNAASLVTYACRTFAGAELCTQAWCKFYEILAKFPDLVSPTSSGEEGEDFRSLHLCEAPGAFIAALNHYLTLRFERGGFDENDDGAWIDVDDIVDDSLRMVYSENTILPTEERLRGRCDFADPNYPSFSCLGGGIDISQSESIFDRNVRRDEAFLRDSQQPARKFGDVSWRWVANTLNPYHEALSSSRAIQADELICRTEEKWIFGSCRTGDILRDATKQEIIARCGGRADLVTGDGGIDCAADPGEQELLVSDLIHSEALVAVSCLRNGGNLVLKVFTVFEAQTVCLLYLLALAFDKVIVHKPVASKPGNSELYLLCFGYNRAEAGSSMKAALTYFSWLRAQPHSPGQSSYALPPLFRKDQIPAAFLDEVAEMGHYFCDLQVATIERNLGEGLHNFGSVKRRCRVDRERVAADYLECCGLRPIPRDMYLVGVRELAEHHGARPTFGGRDPDINVKSYSERMKMRATLHRLRTAKVKDAEYCAELEAAVCDLVRDMMVLVDRSSLHPGLPHPECFSELKEETPVNEFTCPFSFHYLLKSISVEIGSPVHRVLSSPYCPSSLLSQFYEFLDLVDLYSDVDDYPHPGVAENGWPVDITCAFGLPSIPRRKRPKTDLASIFNSGSNGPPSVEAFRAIGRELRVPENNIVIVNVRNLNNSAGYEVFRHPNAPGPSQPQPDPEVVPLFMGGAQLRYSDDERETLMVLAATDAEEFLQIFKFWLYRHHSLSFPLESRFGEFFGKIECDGGSFFERRDAYPLNNAIQRYFDFVWHYFVKGEIAYDRSSYPSLRPMIRQALQLDSFHREVPKLLERTLSAMVMQFEAFLGALPVGLTAHDVSAVTQGRRKKTAFDFVPEMHVFESGSEESLKLEILADLIRFLKGNRLWPKDRLILRGFHLLTRFNVSVFILISSLFKHCSLSSNEDGGPELVLWNFIGDEEDVEDLLGALEEAHGFLSSRRDHLDHFGLDLRPDDDQPTILSLFDSGVDSPILRDGSVVAFARKVNFQYVRGRVRRFLLDVFAKGPDVLDGAGGGDIF